MKKLVSVIAALFTMFTLSAFPKFIMLDSKCGNLPEYTAKFVELDKTKKVSQEHSSYLSFLRAGTWLIEFDDGQKLYASFYKGNIIAGGYVKLLKCEVEE